MKYRCYESKRKYERDLQHLRRIKYRWVKHFTDTNKKKVLERETEREFGA